jgi:hypothetical protein
MEVHDVHMVSSPMDLNKVEVLQGVGIANTNSNQHVEDEKSRLSEKLIGLRRNMED